MTAFFELYVSSFWAWAGINLGAAWAVTGLVEIIQAFRK